MSPSTTLNYVVSGMSCAHCVNAVTTEILAVAGVHDVAIDLEAKSVVVSGDGLDDTAIRYAIEAAGYETAT